MNLLTTGKIAEVFCVTDDFCKEFSKETTKISHLPEDGKKPSLKVDFDRLASSTAYWMLSNMPTIADIQESLLYWGKITAIVGMFPNKTFDRRAYFCVRYFFHD